MEMELSHSTGIGALNNVRYLIFLQKHDYDDATGFFEMNPRSTKKSPKVETVMEGIPYAVRVQLYIYSMDVRGADTLTLLTGCGGFTIQP